MIGGCEGSWIWEHPSISPTSPSCSPSSLENTKQKETACEGKTVPTTPELVQEEISFPFSDSYHFVIVMSTEHDPGLPAWYQLNISNISSLKTMTMGMLYWDTLLLLVYTCYLFWSRWSYYIHRTVRLHLVLKCVRCVQCQDFLFLRSI
jgi:hypothetical protein